MKLQSTRWLFASVALAGLGTLMAQGPGGWPHHGNMDFVAHEMMSKTVTGAPFAADVVTTTTQTLPNGTHINRTSTAALYRDGEGRTRHEVQSLAGAGALTASSPARPTVFIHDPVAQAAYVLSPQKKTAQKMTLPAHRSAGSGRDATASESAPGEHGLERLGASVKTESLGTQVMDGLEVEGTRRTLTIPAGAMGNDQPIQSVTERWYSPDLQVVVKSIRTDPRFGQTVYQLSNIRRGDQPASLFAVPSDYSVAAGGRGPRAAQ
jgi:hypothetical protein